MFLSIYLLVLYDKYNNNVTIIIIEIIHILFSTSVFTMPVVPIDGLLGTEQQRSTEHTGKDEVLVQSAMKN